MIYNEIKRIEEAKLAIRQAIIGKNVDVPATDTIDMYPEYISQIHTGGDDRWHCDDPLCIEPKSGTIYITLNKNYDNTLNDRLVLPEFSYDKQEWIKWEKNDEGAFPTIAIGGANNPQKVYIRGAYIQPVIGTIRQFVIWTNGQYNISGNPLSLIEGLRGELYDSCFNQLFSGSNVVDASRLVLDSTVLKPYCYRDMFSSCTKLTQVPELPATTLAEGCYQSMFSACGNLTQVPALTATVIPADSYNQMFNGCKNITSVTLPMIQIGVNGCYRMFYNCTGLQTVDVSTLTYIGNNGCQEMFYNCSHLTSIADMDLISIGTNGCSGMFMNCAALENAPELVASDGTITSAGEKCMYYMFKDCRALKHSPSKLTFDLTTANSNICQYMFDGCKLLESIPSITSLNNIGSNAFLYMFNGCTGLTDVSDVAFEVANSSQHMYERMFQNCTALTKGPSRLVFNTMTGTYECSYMFNGCINLTQAPELPATTLANYCYQYMFQDCKALTQAPELPATTLANYCYYRMFYGCSKLNSITVRATSWNTSYANGWVTNVSSTGDFHKPASTTIPTGTSGIPSGWTVQEIH